MAQTNNNYNIAQLPDKILNDLRCSRCQEFLSCGPVTILPSTGGSLCGRCYVNDPNNNFRAVAYEVVAAYFLFRCKYWAKHCAYLLNWNDVLDHEDNCTFGSGCGMFCNNPAALFKSDNKLDFTQEITVYNIPETIIDTLSCSYCECYLSSTPIFVNAMGKSICHRCYALKNQNVPNDFVRHWALEKILTPMLYPCIFRNRGCAKYFRFDSAEGMQHEKDCSYGQVKKKPVLKKYTEGKKERGVIETHSGHTYGTITPNSQFFVAQEKVTRDNSFRMEPIKVMPSEAQGIFFRQLMNHRENLVENRWRNSKLNNDVYYQPADTGKALTNSSQNNVNNNNSNLNQNNQSFNQNQLTPNYNANNNNNYYNNNISYYNNYVKPRDMEQADYYQRQTSRNDRNSPITSEPSLRSPSRKDSNRNDFIDEGFNSIDSEPRRYQTYSSESSKSADSKSPRSSVFAQTSPITLNPNDLDAFNNIDRFDNKAQRQDSVNSDARNMNSLQSNGHFRY